MAEKSMSHGDMGLRLNRRAFLGLGWLAALAVLLVRFVGISWQFAIPQRKAGEAGGVFDLGWARDLPTSGSAPIRYPAGRFWLVHTEAGLLALSNVCTHLDCLMDWDETTGGFVCPCHGSQFARDGMYIKGPAPRSLDRYIIRLLDDQGKTVKETDHRTGAPLSIGPIEPAEEIDNTGDTEAPDNPYAHFIVLVDTGRKVPGSPIGDASE